MKLQLELPGELAGAVFAAVGEVLAPPEQGKTSSGATKKWDKKLAGEAIASDLAPLERRLLRRLVEARGQRVAIRELARDLGLPAAPSAEHDFPRLTAFCAEKPAERPFPIASGGSGEAQWYWMSVADAAAFSFAFDPIEETSPARHEESGATDQP